MPESYQVATYDKQFLLELGPRTNYVLVTHPNTLEKTAIFADIAEASASQVPPTVTHLKTDSFSTTFPDIGGGVYKRSVALEASAYDPLASFTSLDGAVWLLDVSYVSPLLFGAFSHSSFDEMEHEVAVDSTNEINAARQYCRQKKLPFYIDGFYRYNGTLKPETGESFLGKGRHSCGIQIWNDNTETGFQILEDNVTIRNTGIQSYLYQAKVSGGGTGMIGVPLITGNFSEGSIPTPKGFYVDNVLLSRKDNETGFTSYTGVALQVSGGSKNGHIGFVEIEKRHSFGVMSHWTGDNDVTHGVHENSVHPREYTIEQVMVGPDIGSLLTISSVGNITIGSVIAESSRSVLTILPGDDLDVNNVGQPGIGSGVYIDQLVCYDVTGVDKTGTNDDAVTVTSQGTSKFRTEEDGSLTVNQLRYDVQIRSMVMHCTDPETIKFGIDLFNYYGRFVVESARITGFTGSEGAGVRIRQSRGDIRINLEHTDSSVFIQDSEAVITGQSDLNDPAGQLPASVEDSYNIKVNTRYWELPANDILRGNSTIVTSSDITRDVLRGHILRVKGTTNGSEQTIKVLVNDFTNNGLNEIHLSKPFPHDMTGVTVFSDPRDINVFIDASLTGARSAVHVDGGTVDIKGELLGGRYNLYAVNPYSVVTYRNQNGVLGDCRTLTESYTVYDMWTENGSVIEVTGNLGNAAVADTGNYFSIGAPTPDYMTNPDYILPQIHINSAIIHDKNHVITPNEDVKLFVDNSRTIEGELYTYFDAIFGVKKADSNANGYWQYHDDGTLDCWIRNYTVADDGSTIWTYPQQCITVDGCVPIASTTTNANRLARAYGITGASCEVTLRDADSDGLIAGNVNLYMKGRWRL